MDAVGLLRPDIFDGAAVSSKRVLGKDLAGNLISAYFAPLSQPELIQEGINCSHMYQCQAVGEDKLSFRTHGRQEHRLPIYSVGDPNLPTAKQVLAGPVTHLGDCLVSTQRITDPTLSDNNLAWRVSVALANKLGLDTRSTSQATYQMQYGAISGQISGSHVVRIHDAVADLSDHFIHTRNSRSFNIMDPDGVLGEELAAINYALLTSNLGQGKLPVYLVDLPPLVLGPYGGFRGTMAVLSVPLFTAHPRMVVPVIYSNSMEPKAKLLVTSWGSPPTVVLEISRGFNMQLVNKKGHFMSMLAHQYNFGSEDLTPTQRERLHDFDRWASTEEFANYGSFPLPFPLVPDDMATVVYELGTKHSLDVIINKHIVQKKGTGIYDYLSPPDTRALISAALNIQAPSPTLQPPAPAPKLPSGDGSSLGSGGTNGSATAGKRPGLGMPAKIRIKIKRSKWDVTNPSGQAQGAVAPELRGWNAVVTTAGSGATSSAAAAAGFNRSAVPTVPFPTLFGELAPVGPKPSNLMPVPSLSVGAGSSSGTATFMVPGVGSSSGTTEATAAIAAAAVPTAVGNGSSGGFGLSLSPGTTTGVVPASARGKGLILFSNDDDDDDDDDDNSNGGPPSPFVRSPAPSPFTPYDPTSPIFDPLPDFLADVFGDD